MNYWANASERRQQAVAHTHRMSQLYGSEIRRSIENTQELNGSGLVLTPYQRSGERHVEFVRCGSVEAIEKYAGQGHRMCVLDFASYNNPGGKFIDGSKAQEECLCHASFLYNVLNSQRIRSLFYDAHKGNSNNCLYSGHSLYVPEVTFNEKISCDVLVCAAPNKKAAMHYKGVASDVADRSMRERCYSVLQVAAFKTVDVLILGAFGCGVFGNNPKIVANEFKALLDNQFRNHFGVVVFAVPDDTNGRYFAENFGGV